jgi:hypothetical protein
MSKLYPWEWLVAETFGSHVARNHVEWLEPAWKMVLSNKRILAILWELFPDSPYLLETHREPTQEMQTWGFVKKPLLYREGANVTISAGLFGTDETLSGEGCGPPLTTATAACCPKPRSCSLDSLVNSNVPWSTSLASLVRRAVC